MVKEGVPTEQVQNRSSLSVLVLFLVAFILALTPLAYDSPPDPTWQLAFFDDDDFDEVVGYITSAVSLPGGPVVCCIRPVPVIMVLKSQPSEDPIRFVPLSLSGPRAPPLA